MKRETVRAVRLILASALLTAAAGPAEAVDAYGPIRDGSGAYVRSTTYYFCNSANGGHSALDICVGSPCGGCGAGWCARSMLSGTWTYNYFGGCGTDCNGSSCNGGAGNYYRVNGSNGYNFRELHLDHLSGTSGTKTVGRGACLGYMGSTGSSTAPHVHADNRQYTTRLTAWYSGVVTCGSPAEADNLVGRARMS